MGSKHRGYITQIRAELTGEILKVVFNMGVDTSEKEGLK